MALVAPAADVRHWTRNTLEQAASHRRLAAAGLKIVLNTAVDAILPGAVQTSRSDTGAAGRIDSDALVRVASRRTEDARFAGLVARTAEWEGAQIRSVQLIGDAAAPGPIGVATHTQRCHARQTAELALD